MYFFCNVTISKLGKKGPKLYIKYRGFESDRKIEINN